MSDLPNTSAPADADLPPYLRKSSGETATALPEDTTEGSEEAGDQPEEDLRPDSLKEKERVRHEEQEEGGLPNGSDGKPLIVGDPISFMAMIGAAPKAGLLLSLSDGQARVRFGDDPNPLGRLIDYKLVKSVAPPTADTKVAKKARDLHDSFMAAYNAARAEGGHTAGETGDEVDQPDPAQSDPAPAAGAAEPEKRGRGRPKGSTNKKGDEAPAASASKSSAPKNHNLTNSGPSSAATLGFVGRLREIDTAIASAVGKRRNMIKQARAEHNIDTRMVLAMMKEDLPLTPDELIDRDNARQSYRIMFSLPAYKPLALESDDQVNATEEQRLDHAEKEGYRAGLRAASRDTCPDETTQFGLRWLQGYDKAQAELRDAMSRMPKPK